jgi:hypothetical protein
MHLQLCFLINHMDKFTFKNLHLSDFVSLPFYRNILNVWMKSYFNSRFWRQFQSNTV